ncbi:hypothetical protein AUK40_03510 [Candidatus Wirthbacteria bacterium CG2_30_54_11]|uniref:Uncharacterized protein n=1 Tax=Candidatus Wirthbacteria bacterium CG2_30_54_11 TaxID=1817892 RepID=A0A1J5IJU8_9BACT|nr:MAG: hypothetical protein AUK40_03510 [Candidatus Wirthbacteria bacterium CG2_30_54_11]
MLSHTFVSSDKSWIMHPVYFFLWWYGKAFVRLLFVLLYVLASVEDFFSVLVMFKAILTLQPLHQDFSVVGRGIGITIRLFWVGIGTLVLAFFFALALALALCWLTLPLVLIIGCVFTFLS